MGTSFDPSPAGRESPSPATAAGAPRRGGGIGRWIGRAVKLAGWLVFAVFVVVLVGLTRAIFGSGENSVNEQYHSLNRLGQSKVAIITLDGPILDGDGFVKKQIDHVRDDLNVKAVVLRIDSPGGSITGSDYIYHHLKRLADERKLPLVVSMGGMAASGGYYVSMAVGQVENTIFAEPTTWTGSIGVIIPHYNVAGLMEKWEVEDDSVKSHPLKTMGSPTRTMTDEERRIFQELVDEGFARFKEIIRSGRKRFRDDPAALDALATGRVFTTSQALKNGLVDREGFVEEAIDRAIALAGLDKEKTRVVKYANPGGLFDLSPFARNPSPAPDLSTLLDLATPRAYYMCTWLPPLARNKAR